MFVKCDECGLTVKKLLLTVLQQKSNFVCTISDTEGDKRVNSSFICTDWIFESRLQSILWLNRIPRGYHSTNGNG